LKEIDVQTLHTSLDLPTLNAMDCDAFVQALGTTFEYSPWVAEGAWAARPFDSVDELHAAMLDVVHRAPRATQLAFLCAHPELAGREAQASSMTHNSQDEQASAGLNAMSREEMTEMARLNGEYRSRHGFPFIIAVRRHTKAQIFEELRLRTERASQSEFTEALAQIGYITRLRVRSALGAHRTVG
jgi:2-oxo-4-hydroxy-4-carboxy-5-ureidoimidazoline decarboxylase